MPLTAGIQFDPECKEEFEILKSRKLKYIIYKIDKPKNSDSKDQTVQLLKSVPSSGDQDQDWKAFKEELSDSTPNFCVFDYNYTNKEGSQKSPIFLVKWCPENTKTKDRMVFAATSDPFKKLLDIQDSNVLHCENLLELDDLLQDKLK